MIDKPIEYTKWGLTRHIVLFAKGHYGRTGIGVMDDLKTLFSNLCACEKKYYSDNRVYQLVLSAFCESCNIQQIEEGMKDAFHVPWYRLGEKEQPVEYLRESLIQSMIGMMGTIQVREIDQETGKLTDIVSLGEVDKRFMLVKTGEVK